MAFLQLSLRVSASTDLQEVTSTKGIFQQLMRRTKEWEMMKHIQAVLKRNEIVTNVSSVIVSSETSCQLHFYLVSTTLIYTAIQKLLFYVYPNLNFGLCFRQTISEEMEAYFISYFKREPTSDVTCGYCSQLSPSFYEPLVILHSRHHSLNDTVNIHILLVRSSFVPITCDPKN